jgi:hypothetical protein
MNGTAYVGRTVPAPKEVSLRIRWDRFGAWAETGFGVCCRFRMIAAKNSGVRRNYLRHKPISLSIAL